MKIRVTELINKEIEVKFAKHATFPIWAIGNRECAKCGWDLKGYGLHP